MSISLEKYLAPPDFSLGDVRDPRVFELDYIPRKIYERKELPQIMELISLYLKGSRIPCIIWGERGSGKTTTVKAILRELPNALRRVEGYKEVADSVKTVYVSAREKPTSYQIYQFLTGMKGGIPASVMKERLKEEKKMILAVDEADLLKDDDLLYFIPRETSIYLILLSRDIRWFTNLDEAVKSSLLPKHVRFNPYTAEEMDEILTMRAKEGLNYFDPTVVSALAGIVVRDADSDTRVGIRSLYWLGIKRSWNENALMDTVKESIKEVEDFSIRMMNNEELVVLYLSIKNKQTNRAYEALPPKFKMSKASFLTKLNRLQEMGLINLIKVSQGRIHTIAVQPLLRHPEIVEEEIEARGLLGD